MTTKAIFAGVLLLLSALLFHACVSDIVPATGQKRYLGFTWEQEAEIGKLYLGVVKKTVDFGAFVEIFPGTEGLVHISHLAHERIAKTTDLVNEGDEVLVRVIDVDKSGKIRLSRKEALDSAGA